MKKLISLLLSVAIMLSALMAAAPAVLAAQTEGKNPFEHWMQSDIDAGKLNFSVEDGYEIVTIDSGNGSAKGWGVDTATTAGEIEYDLRIDKNYGSDDNNFIVYFNGGNTDPSNTSGTKLQMMYKPNFKKFVAQFSGGASLAKPIAISEMWDGKTIDDYVENDEWYGKHGVHPMTVGAWYTVKWTWNETEIVGYLNGTEVLRGDLSAYDYDFSIGTIRFSNYNSKVSLRNIKLDFPKEPEVDETAFADWDLSTNWNLSLEGEDTVANPISAGKGFTLKENTEARELSFDFRLNEFGNPHDGNVGVLYYLASGYRFFFEYNPVAKYYQIRRLNSYGYDENYLAKTENITLDKTTYHTMKVVVRDNQLEMHVDGNLVCSSTNTCGESLGNAKFRVSSYNVAPTIKNVLLVVPKVDETAFADWDLSTNWNLSLEGEDTVANPISAGKGFTLKENTEAHELSFDFRLNEFGNPHDGNVGALYYLASGNRFFFEYNPVAKYYQIRRLDAHGNNMNYLAKTENVTLDKTTYHTMKVVVKDNQLEMYVDGSLVCSANNTCGETLGNAKFRVSSYNVAPTIKNVKMVAPVIDKSAFDCWDTNGWTLGLDGEETIATRVSQNAGAIGMPLKGVSTSREMSFDFKINSIISTSDNNVGILYYLPSGNYFFFEYCHTGKYFQIRRLGSATDYLAKTENHQLSLNKWYTMKVSIAENNLQIFIDDELVCSANNTCSEVFGESQYKISAYNLIPSVKNIKLDNILVDEGNLQYPDWNIKDKYRVQTVDDVQEVYGFTYASENIDLLAATTHDTVQFGMRADGFETQKNIYENTYQGNPVEHSEFGVYYQSAGGNKLIFRYNKITSAWEIVRNNNLDNSKTVLASKAAEINGGQWYDIKAVFKSDVIEMHVDGEKMLTCANNFEDFYSGRIALYSYGIKPSFRGMKLSGGSNINDYADNYDLDFNFDAEKSTTGFTAENGSVSYNSADTSLVFNIIGENATLTSPIIKIPASREGVVEGYQYRAILPERNSILLYLKNNTSANKLKVDFDLSTTNKYYDNQSVTIDIEPNSGYKAYLVNLSLAGTFAGELRGFRLKPIGATAGSIELGSIRFERETDLSYDYAGSVSSCIADEKAETITINGTLDSKYSGKTVTLYETTIYNPYVQLIEDEILTTTKADGISFTFTIPLKNAERNDISRLSSLFIVAVDGVKVSSRFTVDNFEDFKNNPYAKTLDNAINQKNIVNVSDYGAVGDGFTNDTPAIQAAIDDVVAMGGGVVVIPGDTSTQYGKRYSCTSIMIRNAENIELRIEKGATLLQSQTETDYEAIYEKWAAGDCIKGGCSYCKLSYGHNHPQSVFDNPWAHIAISTHYPMLYLREVKNVKITGGGTLRGDDRGSNCENTSNGGDPRLWEGCNSRLHTVLLGGYKVDTAEISNLLIKRCNCYNLSISQQKNVYVGNVAMVEATCSSSDGYAAGTGGVVERMFSYVNDDAMKVSSSGRFDPRNHLWRYSAEDTDDVSTQNAIIRYCNVSGGWGMTFINWSAGKIDYSKCGIRNIEIHDNTFSGYRGSFGHWDDSDPNGVGGGCSTDVYMHNNYYPFQINGSLHSATNFITDLGIPVNARAFKQGNFEHPLFGQEGYEDAYAGLANWSYSGNVGVITESAENHYGYIKDGGKLYQGLYVSAAKHRIGIDTKLVSGSATLYVANARTGKVLAQKDIAISDGFVTNYMAFNVESADDYYLGVELAEGTDAEVYIDNAQLDPPIVPDNPYKGEFTPDAGYVENFKGRDVNVLLWKEHGAEGTFDSVDNALITENSSIVGYGQIGTNDAILYNNVEGNINSIYSVGGDTDKGYQAFRSATQAAFTNSLLNTNLWNIDNSDVIRISDNNVGYGRNSEGFYTYYQNAEGQHTISAQGLENYTRRGQFEYYFPEGATVYNLVIGGHKIEGLRFGSYDIYAANSKETLYNAESLVYSYNDNVVRDYLSLTDPSLQVYNIPEGLSAKYFAIVIYSSCSSDLSKHGSYSVDTCGATRISALQLFGTIGIKRKVEFSDRSGNIIYTASVNEGETLADADISAAEKLLPNVFGYDKMTDENGNIAWSEDVSAPITSDIVFRALYKKSETTYELIIEKADGTSETQHPRFDDKIQITDSDAKYWKLKDSDFIIAVAKNGVSSFYAFGNAHIVEGLEEAPKTLSVEFVRMENGTEANGKRTLTVLAHVNNPEGKAIKRVGVAFLSKTKYDSLSDKNVCWKDAFADGAIPIGYVEGSVTNFMITLKNISATSNVTRYAQAFVEFSDGSVLISENPVHYEFPEIA